MRLVPASLPELRSIPRRRALLACAVALAAAAAVAAVGRLGTPGSAAPHAQEAPAPSHRAERSEEPPPLELRPKVVVAVPPGQAPPADEPAPGSAASRPATDAEVRAELAAFRAHLKGGTGTQTGPSARILPDGTAVAPRGAPARVVAVIAAANEIATKPYKWGGGHGAWKDNGYDCSGSVSFALAGARLLDSPLNSGGFMRWGKPGTGRWITIYTNPGHMFMVVAGLRFDTSGANGGTRWQAASRSTAGLQPRHIPGL